MLWLIVALIGHFSNALAFVIDKLLLSGRLGKPTVYVFFIGTLGLFGFILWPFGDFYLLPVPVLGAAFIAGASFMLALLCFFSALKQGDATRVVPFVGALVPLWTLLFANRFLGEVLHQQQGIGVALLILGAIVISYERVVRQVRLRFREFFFVVAAGGLFALSYTLTKLVFNQTEFINGFLWMRLFAFATVLPFLLLPATRREIVNGQGGRLPALFFVGQFFGALGFILLNWAISLAPQVAVVNALQGIQYGFLFLMTTFASHFVPKLINERLTVGVVTQKVIALVILTAGLALVA